MHALDIILNFFREGGIFLYPIALVWVVGLVIALERFGFIMKAGAGNRRIWSQVQPLLESGKFREALQAVANSETALAHIMRDDDSAYRPRAAAMTSRSARGEPRRGDPAPREAHALPGFAREHRHADGPPWNHHRPDRAFAAVAQANPAEKASLLAASISVAMNNTALGLVTAITLLLAHLYLETKTTEIVDSLEVASVKFLNALNERKMDPESQQDAARAANRTLEAGVRGARA
jgi:biopolymer transport protein ExbB/TolQ